MLYQRAVRPLLFAMDPEDAHLRTMRALARSRVPCALLSSRFQVRDPRLVTTAFGLTFPGPVGLAAGLDKHAEAVRVWPHLGLGFLEVGTVTPRPQPGNPRPRVFRLPDDRALVNRMGFNSVGAEAVARHLRAAGPSAVPLGINVGKNRDTPNDEAAADYRRAIDVLKPHAGYFAINVSSPNTAGLRDLQQPAAVAALVKDAREAAVVGGQPKPVLVKLSPDIEDAALDDIVDSILGSGADGIIVTNTTTSRAGLTSPKASESGGLSGAPLRARANDVCRRVYRRAKGRVPIVGVGGIFTPEDAYERIRAGATVVQVYTALIYEGPGLFARLHRGLLRLLERDGFSQVADAVGIDSRSGAF